MKKTVILFLMIGLLGGSVFAQRCSLEAWVEDNDRQGTNVRSAPGLTGKILAVVPKAAETGDEAEVTIIGYSNGWFKINRVEDVEGKNIFKGTGWISVKKVGIAVETKTNQPANLYALPKRSSKKIGTIPGDADFEIVGFDCFGLKLKYKNLTGWVSREDLCGSPRTTCS